MKRSNILLLVVILLLIAITVPMFWNERNNGQEQNNQKLDEKILVNDQKIDIKDEMPSEPNDVEPDVVKVGDRICGLTVKEIDKFKGVKFDGKVTLSGVYEYTDYTGDGEGYIFTVDEEFRSKLPKLKIDPSSNKSFILHEFDKVDNIFKKGKGRATIVIDNYYLIDSQITTDAELVEVVEMKPEE